MGLSLTGNRFANRLPLTANRLLLICFILGLVSCNTWLDVTPNNEQVTDDYWKSKEDVEAVLASGYYYMRQCTPNYIKWGELRGGNLYSTSSDDVMLQDFNLTPSYALCNYATLYKAISMANSVLKYAPSVRTVDDTYAEGILKSHLAEAYFIRAYNYFILMKNYKEIPLITDAYVNDEQTFYVAKSSEEDIIRQIKADLNEAISSNSAKSTYDDDWATKGRATKWALYALMADVCLWNAQVNGVDDDFEECAMYCNLILDAKTSGETFYPAFMSNTANWYSIFYPGNSNESIFELNWDYNQYQETNNFSSLFTISESSRMKFTTRGLEEVKAEISEVLAADPSLDGRVGRMLLATCVPSGTEISTWQTSPNLYIWKYRGNDVANLEGLRVNQDANFILYRVSEIMLMKAEALVMRGSKGLADKGESWKAALALIDQIRQRARLDDFKGIDPDGEGASQEVMQLDELTLIEEILHQREMEFVAEGKRWYDLLRFGRMQNYAYEENFKQLVLSGNQTTTPDWIKSVLMDRNAWYLPIPQSEIDVNKLLEQNPYYE